MIALVLLALASAARWTSADPLDHWTRSNVGSPALLRGVAYGQGRFVAVGDYGKIFFSQDGLFWSPALSTTVGSLRAIAFGNGLFVVAEGAYNDPSAVLTSADGIEWVRQETGFRLSNVAFWKHLFVATLGDSGGIGTSADGIHWVFEGVSTIPYAIGFSDSLVIVAGSQTYTSVTGNNWIPKATGINSYASIACGNGVFAGVGLLPSSPAGAYTTIDGSAWIARSIPGPAFRWGTVAFAHDTFVMVGDSGSILTSATGTNWIERAGGEFYDTALAFVAYGKSRAIAVGANGVVLLSDHCGPAILQIVNQPSLRLQVSAPRDKLCIVEKSTDLQTWTELTRYTNLTESAEIARPATANQSEIFRVVTSNLP